MSWFDIVQAGLAATGLLCVLGFAYTFVSPRAEGGLPDELVDDLPGHGPDLVSLTSTHLSRSLTHGNAVRLLVNGDRIFPEMLRAIREAEHRIHLLTYVYWQGDIAEIFADELSAAAERGVVVRVLIDAYGGSDMEDDVVDRIRESGAHFAWFHPLRWYNANRLNLRTHRKIMVVDSEVAFVGGVGIAEEWTGDAGDLQSWRDNHFEVTGPVVGPLEGAFAENWLDATGELLRSGLRVDPEDVETPPAATVDRHMDDGPETQGDDPRGARRIDDIRITTLATSSRGDLSPVAFVYWAALRLARERVDICTPYFVPAAGLLDAIEHTARRGVRVRLVIPGETNDSVLVRLGSLAHYPRLLDAGVELYEYLPTMMHTKLLVVDDRWCIFGSANFDNRSFELNDEILLVADSAALAEDVVRQLDVDVSHSHRVGATEPFSLGRLRRFAARVALLMHRQL